MLHYHPIPTEQARAYQADEGDAYGHRPERSTSDGSGNPCRHCLSYIPKGADMLVFAHRPFGHTQPYAETGPVFLCATRCSAPDNPAIRPEIMKNTADLLLRGYDSDDRIVYGTGEVVACADVELRAERILDHPKVAYVHVRSAANNCYRLKIDRP
ncbi:Protein of unknown function [Shimia gijangensis]|uniref:DUF1203 domain-containing protein n=1 Tax=Shimia gijangensis TaxID=1470563 RepID=A0A1M6NMG9_9RHOB|nr:DUF1203 domain-containing protein [Shimia gijangensis]SHJ96752.1 Protein of unknown function [Shimia gijangensis]